MKRTFWMIALIMASCLAVLISCGGGGSGSSESSTDINSQTANAIVDLNEDDQNGLITQEQFLNDFELILAAVDAELDGPANFITYLETYVVGDILSAQMQPAKTHRAATVAETIANIKNSTTFLMLETFVTSVASSLLLPDPVSNILDFAKPEVFTSMASGLVRVHTYDAIINGDIDVLTGNEIVGKIQNNPFDAERDLLAAKGETVPDWLESYNDVCMWDCITSGTGIYSGPFSGIIYETWGGCTWRESVSGTVEVVVTGNGTLADPYEGTFDVSGNIVIELQSGVDCDPGGEVLIDSFDGTVSGTSGKLNASGEGVAGTGTFSANISGATVSTSAITGGIYLDFDSNIINQTITLTKQY